jgi:UrcA family protein
MNIESGMKKVVLMACVMLGAGATAMAGDATEMVSRTVKYDATAAATPAGAVALYAALRSAASRVCTDAGSPAMALLVPSENCKADALSRAVADVKIDAVTALHLRDSGYKAKAGIVTIASR